jgi:DNA-binding MarR family transcriptional regulator
VTDVQWLTDGEMATWREFVTAAHLLERRIEEQLKGSAGLSHALYEILVVLSAAPERRMRMTELARAVVVTKSRLTYQIDLLVKRGLVERHACSTDDRGVLAVLTEQGRACLEETAPGHVEVVREGLIDRLTPEEMQTLTRAMRKVRLALER